MIAVSPLESYSAVGQMVNLNNTEYIYVTHTNEGHIDIIEGPTVFCPGPYDEISHIKKKIALTNRQYVKIVDKNTGIIRTVPGPATITLKQYEEKRGDVEDAHEINALNAVYVLNTDSGTYELITNQGMFFPKATQEIIEVRNKIRLEQNEVMVLIDKDGQYIFKKGDDETRSFFLPPYCKILEQEWSTDIEKKKGSVKKVQRFDLRPIIMDFEFLIRTRDNVEIILKLNIYWKIRDVSTMVSATHDVPGDICNHVQSQILSEISRVHMQEFMESFNEVVQKAIGKEDDFYSQRGVEVIRVEITGRRCKDPKTEENFQEIIKKKTDRIKNLEQQASQNEVRVAEIEGQIKAEQLTGELVNVKRAYQRKEAEQIGESEGARAKHFIDALPDNLTKEQKLAIYFDEQNTKRVGTISKSGANIYLTQKELDIKMVNLNYHSEQPSVGDDRKKDEPVRLLPIKV